MSSHRGVSQDEKLKLIMDLTNSTLREAQWMLRNANGDLSTALSIFYEQESARAPQKTAKPVNTSAIQKLFDKYEDPDKKDCITVDGTMELCQDLGIDPTQLDFLLVSYHLGSTQMGEFTRQPFVDGCVTLECSSIDQLKQSLATTFKNDLQDPAYFRKVYNYAFLFGRQGGQKNLALDAAVELWKLLLTGRFNLLDQWIEFLEEKHRKAISRDTWNLFLDFASQPNFDVDTHDAEGAWPILIDEQTIDKISLYNMSLEIQPDEQRPLTQAEEEEMSSALIARLLAQDGMGESDHYSAYGNASYYYDTHHEADNGYDDGSDDYAPQRNKKAKKPKVKERERQQRSRKRKDPPADIGVQPTTATLIIRDAQPLELNENSPGNPVEVKKIKKIKKPLPPGCNTGAYTDNEETLFLEGLELHGRSWSDLAKHMGTRDPHSIRSHAQKHFIKLFRDSLPLPDKVKESGEGFTLSGKPLDPESAAAKPYLNRATIKVASKNTSRQHPAHPSPSNNKDGIFEKDDTKQVGLMGNFNPPRKDTELVTEELNIGGLTLIPAIEVPPATATPNSKPKSSPAGQKPVKGEDLDGCTNHASSNLRLSIGTMPVPTTNESDTSPLMQGEPCLKIPDPDSSFKLTVHSNALLTMDLHAHLTTGYSAGFLAGEWDKATQRILVKEAYPCTPQDSINVEMESICALKIRHLIQEKNLTVVGWYQSHPTCTSSLVEFETHYRSEICARGDLPSFDTISSALRNINSTREINDSNSHNDRKGICSPKTPLPIGPFVGAIVSSYDSTHPIAHTSPIDWFSIGNDGIMPNLLVYDIHEDTGLSVEEETRLLQLPIDYKSSSQKVDFCEYWRLDSKETKLERLIKSLSVRMPWLPAKNLHNDDDRTAALSSTDASMEEHRLGGGGGLDTFWQKMQATLKDW